MSLWRVVLLVSCVTAFAMPAWAVSLLNGSVLTVNGLTLTVSGCSMILAGVTQSSCASGHLLLQALSSGTGYAITGDGSGSNGGNVLSEAEGSGLSQLRFSLSIAPAVLGPVVKIASAALTLHGSVPNECDLNDISFRQTFSAAAGGGTLQVIPASSNTGSLSLTPSNTFSISNTLAINTGTYNGWGSIQVSTVQQVFAPVPEPASIAVLAAGGLGLFAVRRYSAARRCSARRKSRPGSARLPMPR